MRSYRPETLFDTNGRLRSELQALSPSGDRRMGANPHANGGLLKRELQLPDYRGYAVEVPCPGGSRAEATRQVGEFLRDVIRLNSEARNFRVMGPDETASNRLDAVFATNRAGRSPRLSLFQPGLRVYHCHILEHEERGMMGTLNVE